MTDSERLDWLEKNAWSVRSGYGLLDMALELGDGSLRSAIDATAAETWEALGTWEDDVSSWGGVSA